MPGHVCKAGNRTPRIIIIIIIIIISSSSSNNNNNSRDNGIHRARLQTGSSIITAVSTWMKMWQKRLRVLAAAYETTHTGGPWKSLSSLVWQTAKRPVDNKFSVRRWPMSAVWPSVHCVSFNSIISRTEPRLHLSLLTMTHLTRLTITYINRCEPPVLIW